jgi:hypothetical protein
MKFVKTTIFLMYLIVYVYSCYMTSVEPNKIFWGYICAGVFGVLFIMLVSILAKNQKKNLENNKENNNQ